MLLKRYLPAKAAIEQLDESIRRVRSNAMRITPTLSQAPGGGDSTNALPKAMELILPMEQERDEKAKFCNSIDAAISELENDDEKTVLRYKYTAWGYSYGRIAKKMQLSSKTVQRVHDKAVGNLNSVSTNVHVCP